MQRLTHSTQQPFASRFYVVLSSANRLTAMQHSQLVIFCSHKRDLLLQVVQHYPTVLRVFDATS